MLFYFQKIVSAQKRALLLYNRLVGVKGEITTSEQVFEKEFTAIFPEAFYMEVDGNRVLANRKAWD